MLLLTNVYHSIESCKSRHQAINPEEDLVSKRRFTIPVLEEFKLTSIILDVHTPSNESKNRTLSKLGLVDFNLPTHMAYIELAKTKPRDHCINQPLREHIVLLFYCK